MVVSKQIKFTLDDFDTIIKELAKEIDSGFTVKEFQCTPSITCRLRDVVEVTLVPREGGYQFD